MAVNISAWSIRQPLPSIVGAAVLMLLGWLAFNKLPITRLPNVDVPVISVTITQFGSAPAELWLVDTGPDTPSAKFGVIASVSHAFCSTCDRTRLTADGQIRSCLFSAEETDLRGLLRGGAGDDAIEAAWRAAMWGKPAGHGINDPDFIQPARPMSAIGG